MPKRIKLRTELDIKELGVDLEELKASARLSIEEFFSDKLFHCGGPIPECLLLSDDSVMTVLGTTVDAWRKWEEEKIYPLLRIERDQINERTSYHNRSVSFNVHYTLRLIDNLRDHGIPKHHRFGMMLLYYKFCKGFQIPPAPATVLL
jgi:hypothetical protein